MTLALLAACSGAPPVTVREPPGAPAPACTRLNRMLPEDLDGRGRRETRPTSARTAAWGEPPVVLRCGVPRPAGLSATSEVLEVDGVEWFLEETRRAYVFTTTGRRVYVELRVPGSTPRDRATSPLVDIATSVARTIPDR